MRHDIFYTIEINVSMQLSVKASCNSNVDDYRPRFYHLGGDRT